MNTPKVKRSPRSRLVVPVITRQGEMEEKTFQNTYINNLALHHKVKWPMLIKEIDRPDSESYSEFRHLLLSQLLEIPSSKIDVDSNESYLPLYPLGSTRSKVVFVHEKIHEELLKTVKCSEEVIAYLKAAVTTEYFHGLFELNDINLVLKEDNANGKLTDGLGYISSDLMEKLGAKNIIQFRMLHKRISKPGIAKGILKIDHTLPSNTIVLSKSQLKGKINDFDWNGRQSLDIGILRKFEGPPSNAKESYSFLEFHHDIRDSEIPQAIDQAQKYIDILKDPLLICEHQGVLNRDSDKLSLVDSLLKISTGTRKKSSRLPPLEKHPYITKSITQMMASKLRHLALSGSREWPYPVLTEILLDDKDRIAVNTNLFPVGTEVAVARYPLLEGRNIGYGIVTGPSDSDSEISIGRDIAEITSSDSDGDCLMLMDEPNRVAIAKKIHESKTETIKKNHSRLNSSLYELNDVIIKNLFSASIGSATLASISCELKGDTTGRRFMVETIQASTDSIKWDVNTREGQKRAKEYLDTYSLPDHITHRNDKSMFANPDKTKIFNSSPLWKEIATLYKSEMTQIKQESLPLRAFSGIFGHEAFELNKEQIRELTAVYRWYCYRVKSIHQKDINTDEKNEEFNNLIQILTSWKSQLSGCLNHWACAAWSIVHSSNDKNNIGAFIFHVFKYEILELLINTYDSVELIPMTPLEKFDDGTIQFRIHWIHKGLSLIPDIYQKNLMGENKYYYHSKTMTQVPEIHGINSPNKELAHISIVSLEDGVNPDQVEELIKSDSAQVKPINDRYLPLFNSYALGLYKGDDKLGEIKDSSIPFFLKHKSLKGDIVKFNKSLKVFYSN